MSLVYEELTQATREIMRKELERDLSYGREYRSPRLRDIEAQNRWLVLLDTAMIGHDDSWLAASLRTERLLKTTESARSKSGVPRPRRVPSGAADTLAEGEFNAYYMRALALQAIEQAAAWGTDPVLEVVRRKEATEPRTLSDSWIGRTIPATNLLHALRDRTKTREDLLGVPGGPNSGITVRSVTPLALSSSH